MAWALRAAMGLALAFAASVAMAGCPGPCGGYGQDGYLSQDSYYEAPPSYDEFSPSYGYARQHYAGGGAAVQASDYGGQGYGPPPPCRCDMRGGYDESYGCGGEVSVPYSFFYDNGGVGPLPSDGYGGGYYMVNGGGFLSARAGVPARVSIGVHGRHGGGGHK